MARPYRPYMAIASGSPWAVPSFVNESLDGLKYEFLITIKRDRQVFAMFSISAFDLASFKRFRHLSKTNLGGGIAVLIS